MMTGTPESVTLVPISRIQTLNSRDRNLKVFEEIVDNIRSIGLKKPITVTERPGDDGQVKYLLVCGEGRLNAFRILGESHIPALIVDVSDEDAFIMSLAENIARRGYRPLEILADIELLRKRGYSAEIIIQKTGLSPKYVKDIMFLLDQGEERLIEAVQRGTIPLTSNIHWQALTVDRAARAASLAQTPRCIWFTGLSGSGKSTIANLLEKRLHAQGRHTYILDGDNLRHGLSRDLGFTQADRVENIRRVAEVAKLMVDAGLLVLVSFISPFRAEREMARSLFAPGEFVEVFVDASLAECEQRDPKGLYAKARRGELKNFTGIDSPYEAPLGPDVHLQTAIADTVTLVDQMTHFLNVTTVDP